MRQSIRAAVSKGFRSKQMTPAAEALASRPGSVRAVIIMKGMDELREASSRFRSKPLIPGIWISVTMQSHELSPPDDTNSSADAKPRGSNPNEASDSMSAVRNGSSSSITAIEGSLATLDPFPRQSRPEEKGGFASCRGSGRSEIIRRCYRIHGCFGFIVSAIRTRSASVRAFILRIAAPR